ncbi:MAG: Txe/YoeB family addiction module toxin [Bdellovibrionales bacterium]
MIYKIRISAEAKKDLQYWEKTDPKKKQRIKDLIKNIAETPFDGIGKPEALKHDWSGFWSRRIDREHRLIYRIKDNAIEIARCRYHY